MSVGVVIIGRNEGERLVRCLESVHGAIRVVYVDSGSRDGSVERAREVGAEVVELDVSRPFTAARARNSGFARLRELEPALRWVQFVDGDCEVREGWLAAGETALEADAVIAAVCGRLRERHPERSIYNRMCDIGWNYPMGEIAACGGVAMYNAERFAGAGGFNEGMIAGEEFELCNRLRAAGGRVLRIDAEMAWHDVGITRLSQWWMRAVRSGFGAAEAWVLYDAKTGSEHRRRVLRALLWGVIVPAVALCGIVISWASWAGVVIATFAVGAWMVNWGRLCLREKRRQRSMKEAVSLSGLTMLGKLAEARGVAEYAVRRLRRGEARVIEYRRA